MSITSPPPRPSRPGVVVDRDELEALVEALIEEARQRTRRRRRRNGVWAVLALLAGLGLYLGLDHGGGGPAETASATPASNGVPPAARAGARRGVSRGPGGGHVYVVAVSPSAPRVVYVGTAHGVFRSTNAGRSWVSAGLAPPPGAGGASARGVMSLAVDPRVPTAVYAGLADRWDPATASSRPLFETTDGGRTWRALELRGQVVAIAPTSPPTVYAATGGPGGASRLLRSTDGGRSWRSADSGLPSPSTYPYRWELAFDPATPATVYAATGGEGVFESDDAGGSWHLLDASGAYGGATAVAVDPRHPGALYAGTDAGVIKSLDGGSSWRRVNAAMSAHGRDRWYGQVSGLAVDPRDPRTVYATTICAGVFESRDGGRNWDPANAGLVPQCGWAYSLALDPRARRMFLADPGHGVLERAGGGTRWSAANTGLDLSRVFSLAVDPRRPGTVYASADELGLFASDDGGAHWHSLRSGPGLAGEIALDPSSPRTLLAVAKGYGVVRSTDAGRTWAGARIGAGARRVHVVAISGGTAYAGGRGLYASRDGGRSWRVLGGLGALGAVDVRTLAISPKNDAVVYAGITAFGRSGTGGLYESTDRGKSWRQLTDLPVDEIALDPENPATLYVAGDGGVLRTSDGGAGWRPASSGLPRSERVTALALDPVHPTTLYAAVSGRGVFTSTDSARRWRRLDAGPTGLDVGTLAVDPTGRTVYAGTAGEGVVSLHRFR